MILGILGHVVRFGIYSMAADPGLLWLVILSNVVHGFAYAFFFATVYIFVDENFPKDVRTSAQSLFNLLILGLGPLVGQHALGQAGRPYLTEDPATKAGSISTTAVPVPARVRPLRRGDPGALLPPQGQGSGTRRGPRPGKLNRSGRAV